MTGTLALLMWLDGVTNCNDVCATAAKALCAACPDLYALFSTSAQKLQGWFQQLRG